jgi:hypothetical protein
MVSILIESPSQDACDVQTQVSITLLLSKPLSCFRLHYRVWSGQPGVAKLPKVEGSRHATPCGGFSYLLPKSLTQP